MTYHRSRSGVAVSLIAFFILLSALLSGCTKSPKSEKEIIEDLQNSSSFYYGVNYNLKVTDYEVTKRRTESANYIDTIYIDVVAENNDISCTMSYIINYGLYNDGWELESIERDYDNNKEFFAVPLHGMSDEEIQLILDSYISNGFYDTIEVYYRDTDLTDNACTENVYMYGTKEYTYGIENVSLRQDWYFDPISGSFTSPMLEPEVLYRTATLKDSIIGVTWQPQKISADMSAFADSFTVEAIDLVNDGNNNNLMLALAVERTTHGNWVIGDEVRHYRKNWVFQLPLSLKYLKDVHKWCLDFYPLNDALYEPNEEEQFTEYTTFSFDLESREAELGYYYPEYNLGDPQHYYQYLLEEEIDHPDAVVNSPLPGLWVLDSENSEYEDVMWFIDKIGNISGVASDSLEFLYLAGWELDNNDFIFTNFSAGDDRESLKISWSDDNTFTLESLESGLKINAHRLRHN